MKKIIYFIIFFKSVAALAGGSFYTEEVKYFEVELDYIEYSEKYKEGYFNHKVTFKAEVSELDVFGIGYMQFLNPTIKKTTSESPLTISNGFDQSKVEFRLCEMIGFKDSDSLTSFFVVEESFSLLGDTVHLTDRLDETERNIDLEFEETALGGKRLIVKSFGCDTK